MQRVFCFKEAPSLLAPPLLVQPGYRALFFDLFFKIQPEE